MDKLKKMFPYPIALFAIYWNSIFIGAFTIIITLNAEYLSEKWGLASAAGALAVVGASGIGKAIAQPLTGMFSDKFGRKRCFLTGCAIYIIFLVSMLVIRDVKVAYFMTAVAGVGNAFIDNSCYSGVIECVPTASSSATVATKIFFSLGNMTLPALLGIILSRGLDNSVTFFVFIAWVVISVILAAVAKWPPANVVKTQEGEETDESGLFKESPRFWVEGILLIIIGFTSYTTFYMAQQSFKVIGMNVLNMNELSAANLVSVYSIGSIVAVVLLTFALKKIMKSVTILVVFPIGAVFSLLSLYVFRTPEVAKIAAFAIGFFAAGGVFQLAIEVMTRFFPRKKGFYGSLISFTGSISIFILSSLVGYFADTNPMALILIDIIITCIGIVCGMIVNIRYRRVMIE